jgi:hypothetical protein
MTDIAPADGDLRERVIWVVNEFVGAWRKYQYLEKRTGISARKWQNMCNRVQQPSLEMIAALAEYRPYFVTWMLTGRAVPGPQLNPSKAGWGDRLLRHQASALGLREKSKTGESSPSQRGTTEAKRSEAVTKDK